MAVALTALTALVFAAPAGAFTGGTTYTLDIKVAPSSFKAGTQLDIPVYLVENRPPANGGSQLAQYNLGKVYGSFGSAQSKFTKFTPAAGLVAPTIIAQENPWILPNGSETLVQFTFASPGTPGLAVTPDNSGITGRTEVLIGTVRTEVGPAIPQQGGLPIVFEMVVKPSGGTTGVDGKTSGGGEPGLGGIPTRHIQVFAEPPGSTGGDDKDKAASACAAARAKARTAKKQASKAQVKANGAARRAKNAAKAKKAKAQRQANQARKRAAKAKVKQRRAQRAAKTAC